MAPGTRYPVDRAVCGTALRDVRGIAHNTAAVECKSMRRGGAIRSTGFFFCGAMLYGRPHAVRPVSGVVYCCLCNHRCGTGVYGVPHLAGKSVHSVDERPVPAPVRSHGAEVFMAAQAAPAVPRICRRKCL